MARDKKGKFIEGHKGYKPKGAINKVNRDIKELHQKIVNAIDDIGVMQIIQKCKPDTLIQYAARVMPKDVNVKTIKTLESWTIDEMKQELNRLINEQKAD